MDKRWLMGMLVGVSLVMGAVTGHAATSSSSNADLEHAIATAPQGIPLDKLFAMSGEDNFTKLIGSPLVDQSIAQITRNNPTSQYVQAGAIWSKTGLARMNNQFDLSQDTQISMWLYFGNKGRNAAEGMAFVLQNSTDGIWAIAGGGQALGVWGNDRGGHGRNVVAQTAIDHSWALEFDTHVNNSGAVGQADAFDMDANVQGGMHIGSGYPGLQETYTEMGGEGSHYSSLNHTQPKPVTNFADAQWHHLSLSWNATKKQMTYRYNDRDAQTNTVRSGMDIVQDTINIDPKKLGATADRPNVYWGVTGSTSARRSENGLVMIDSSDTLGQITAHATLENTTTHHALTAGSRVAMGDQLTYRYTFDYDAATSHQDIQPLTMDLPLPQPLKVTGGGVSYNGGPITEPFSATELQAGTIHKDWKQGLDATHHQAVVTITGTVPPVSHNVPILAVNARFYGPNYQTQLPLPSVQIQADVAPKLTNLGVTTQQLGHHEDARLRVRLTNQDQPFAVDELANYQIRGYLNGQALPAAELSTTWTAGQLVGTADLMLPATRLKTGDNQLMLQAQDKTNAAVKSNPVTITLKRDPGTLHFAEVSDQADFVTTQLTGSAQRIHRQPGWQLSVADERGTGHGWKLVVRQGQDFQTATGQPLSGQLLWGDQPINEIDTQIAKHTTQSDADVVSVSGHWQADKGPLLAIHSDTLAGQYHGTLEWRLQDTP
ncbi:L-type lectin-domain containing protein [Levilactobacillus angrenensis]|uniref:L-type lectin-domain containing protein n=1 Tax=Levilactobacillus angrenensis TaxID=2486020 RepID=A0ABW1UCK5_9LACO|nr:L-type lectin-domain containing protein [Levilactobacillus angrenensis]